MKRVEQREEAVIKLYQLKVKSDIEKSSSSYTDMLITGVLENKEELDSKINKYLSNWTLDRLSLVDQAILEVASFEILYTAIDIKIAINEALELAKKYSDDKVKSMINACLDKIAKEKVNG